LSERKPLQPSSESPLLRRGMGEAFGGGFRAYRNQFSQQRFRSFGVNYKDTDLWIGVDPASFREEMKKAAHSKVVQLRSEMEAYLLNDPVFGQTFEPYRTEPNAPEIVRWMAEAANRAGVGPMAAVAGAFSEAVGRHLIEHFDIQELVVENGGDIFLKIESNLLMSVYAGNSPLSEKIGIDIQASESPLGVCTSAGTVGPSVSLGKTDATMIICRNTALADALATTFGNLVQTPDDVSQVIQQTEKFPEILSAVIICQDKVGIRGQFIMKFIK